MSSLGELQKTLKIKFKNTSILKQALVHTSYINENPEAELNDNQRMEFLGDALVNFIIAEKLYHDFPKLPEGKLTDIRISLIRQEKLAEKASALKLGNYLLLGKGEDLSEGRSKRNNLADTFEAVVAAIFLDQGVEQAKSFVLANISEDIKSIKAGQMELNFKALLQELTQAEFKSLPDYEVIESVGPDHDRIFIVSVSLGEVVLAIGSGKSKKEAETEAAHKAYDKLSAVQRS